MAFMEKDSVLEMRHIYKTFPGVKALQNVDFTLKKGKYMHLWVRTELEIHSDQGSHRCGGV